VSFRQTEARWAKEFAVEKKRFSVEQIVAVLKQAELGMPVADLIRQVGSRSRPSTSMDCSRIARGSVRKVA